MRDQTVECGSGDERRAQYQSVRNAFNAERKRSIELSLQAARMLFLNKTCHNGIWRENRGGEFNSGYRNDKNVPAMYDADALRAAGRRQGGREADGDQMFIADGKSS